MTWKVTSYFFTYTLLGGISIDRGLPLNVTNVAFESNSVSERGGAMSTFSTILRITNNTFSITPRWREALSTWRLRIRLRALRYFCHCEMHACVCVCLCVFVRVRVWRV